MPKSQLRRYTHQFTQFCQLGNVLKKTMSPTLVYHWAYHGLPYLSCWIIIRNFGEMESIWNQSFGRQGFDRSLGGMQGVVGLWMILVAGPCTFPEAAQLKHVKTTGWGLSEIREPKKNMLQGENQDQPSEFGEHPCSSNAPVMIVASGFTKSFARSELETPGYKCCMINMTLMVNIFLWTMRNESWRFNHVTGWPVK